MVCFLWREILLCVLLHRFVSAATFNTLHINICISNMIPELTVHVSVKLLKVQQGMFGIKQMRKQVFCIIYNLFFLMILSLLFDCFCNVYLSFAFSSPDMNLKI